MTGLVGAAATVHAPLILGMPKLAPEAKRVAVDAGFARLRSYVEQCRPDVIVTISSEHITNFLADDCPAFATSSAATNPVQPEFGLAEAEVPSHPAFSSALVSAAQARGVPIEARDGLRLDHGTNLPLSYLTPDYAIPVVPVIVNTVWQPLPPMAQAVELGFALHEAAERSGLRIFAIAAGGISHWVGNARHGDMNEEFDVRFLDMIRHADLGALSALTDAEIDVAGDGAHEVRSWVSVAHAAARAGLVPEVVLEETFVPGWNVSVYQVRWIRAER
jgi:aromatic ring-opening dioxygenase catalytic subunit (LigB family)